MLSWIIARSGGSESPCHEASEATLKRAPSNSHVSEPSNADPQSNRHMISALACILTHERSQVRTPTKATSQWSNLQKICELIYVYDCLKLLIFGANCCTVFILPQLLLLIEVWDIYKLHVSGTGAAEASESCIVLGKVDGER